MSTYLAERIRAIHQKPTRDNIDQLRAVADQVQRMEEFCDRMVMNEWSKALAAAAAPRIVRLRA